MSSKFEMPTGPVIYGPDHPRLVFQIRGVAPTNDTLRLYCYLPHFGEVGWLHFGHKNEFNQGRSTVIDIFVCDTYRRLGIATAMWNALIHHGYDPVPSPWTTPDGEAFLVSLSKPDTEAPTPSKILDTSEVVGVQTVVLNPVRA